LLRYALRTPRRETELASPVLDVALRQGAAHQREAGPAGGAAGLSLQGNYFSAYNIMHN